MHPATSRRRPTGLRCVLVGIWPVLVVAAGLLLVSTALAGLLVWAIR